MQQKSINTSKLDSIFFQLSPSFFKVGYSFAKTMKAGSIYRLVIFKGIKIVDQMSEGIKGRLVGGKILFDFTILNFSISYFTPSKNIEFVIKLFESNQDDPQFEIAEHRIKSGTYVQQFINNNTSHFREQIQLLSNFTLAFDLFLHNSKKQLDGIVKSANLQKNQGKPYQTLRNNTPVKFFNSDIFSNSDASSIKKLSRRRGHEGKLKFRNQGKDSDASSREGSFQQRKTPISSINKQKNQQFLNASFKQQHLTPQKSEPNLTKSQNLVTVIRKDSNSTEIYPSLPSKPIRYQSNLQKADLAKHENYNKFTSIVNDIPVLKFSEYSKKESISDRDHSLQKKFSKISQKIELSQRQTNLSSDQRHLQEEPTMKYKRSVMSISQAESVQNLAQEQLSSQFESTKDKVFYFLFFVISALLFYNAVTPTRRV